MIELDAAAALAEDDEDDETIRAAHARVEAEIAAEDAAAAR